MMVNNNNAPVPPPAADTSSYYGNPVEPKKISKGLVIAIVALVVLFLVAPSAWLMVGSAPFSLGNQVAVIHLNGNIGSDSGANTPEGLYDMLQEAENDPGIVAVVLRVNSGGGYAASGEEMATYVKNFSKPIVVSTEATNASAAYLISSQADYLYTNSSASVGGIGAAMRLMDYSQLLNMLGIQSIDITSSSGKDSSYGTRPLTEDEIAIYQDQVNQINQTFISAVAEGRGLSTEEVTQYANGMTMTGTDAVEKRLFDEVGTFQDACNKAAELAGVGFYDIYNMDGTTLDLLSLLGSSTLSSQAGLLSGTNSTPATATAQ